MVVCLISFGDLGAWMPQRHRFIYVCMLDNLLIHLSIHLFMHALCVYFLYVFMYVFMLGQSIRFMYVFMYVCWTMYVCALCMYDLFILFIYLVLYFSLLNCQMLGQLGFIPYCVILLPRQ